MPDELDAEAPHPLYDDPRQVDLPASDICECGATFRQRWPSGTDECDDVCSDCHTERAARLVELRKAEAACACNKSHDYPSDGACGCDCHAAIWGPRGGR